MKLFTVLWMTKWVVRLLIAPIAILPVFALYFGLHETWPVGRLVLTIAAVVAGIAVVSQLFVYKRGENFY